MTVRAIYWLLKAAVYYLGSIVALLSALQAKGEKAYAICADTAAEASRKAVYCLEIGEDLHDEH